MKIDNTLNAIQLKNQSENTEEVREKKLHKACEEFEAIILQKLFSSMRDTLPEGGIYKDNYARDMFQSMHDKSLAQELAHSEGTGLGEMLFKQLLEKQRS